MTTADDSSGRKLTWLWQHSKNELKTSYLNQKYIFMTSSYQMAILVQYNDGDSHSYADLATATKMNESLLKPMLQHLVKTKVLLQDGDDYDLNLSEFLMGAGVGVRELGCRWGWN